MQQCAAEAGERECRDGDEDRAHLNGRAADMPEAAVSDPPERQRIREDVRGPVEEDDEQRPHRERNGERRADPTDDRAARAVRLDREEVRARARGRRDEQPDREREQEAATTDARLRHRAGARSDQQRDENAECDQLTEGEVHDARQPEDDRVADADEPVDGTSGKPARKDLQRQRHHAAL
jgi:hypothetical protein